MTLNTIFDEIRTKLLKTQKIPHYAYSVILESLVPEKQTTFWNDFNDLGQVNWEKINLNNFKCTINTRIRSFYFKLFHRAIGLNEFLFKIKRTDSPNCSLCNTAPETYIHIFVECPVVKPIWDEIIKIIMLKINKPLNISIFEKMFGCDSDNYSTYLFLLFKYYIYICKFQNKSPSFEGYKSYIDINKNLEYCIAKKNNKLPIHFRKWSFQI